MPQLEIYYHDAILQMVHILYLNSDSSNVKYTFPTDTFIELFIALLHITL